MAQGHAVLVIFASDLPSDPKHRSAAETIEDLFAFLAWAFDAFELPVVLEVEQIDNPEVAIGAWFANAVAFISNLCVVIISPVSRSVSLSHGFS